VGLTGIATRLAGEPFGSKTLAVLIKCPLRGFVLAHGLLSVDPTLGIAGLTFFGGTNLGWAV
jgi:hypothetical protein